MFTPLPGYDEALTSAAFYIHEKGGYLRISGADRSAFLQRQSTNDLSRLSPGRFLVTVLTSPAARILDVLVVIPVEGEAENLEALDAVTLPGRGPDTARFLRSRIFFMDKVTLEDLSQTMVEFSLTGPAAPEVLIRLGISSLPVQEQVLALHLGNSSGRLFHQTEGGFRLLIPADQAEMLAIRLSELGAVRLSSDSYNLLRIEAGLPSAGRELVEDYTPLEVGLESAISSTKGCYTGQEVIARQLTYDKVTRRLVGLALDNLVNSGERLWSVPENQPAGEITSVAASPRFGAIALAVVKRPFTQTGTQLVVGEKGGKAGAKVVPLPFSA